MKGMKIAFNRKNIGDGALKLMRWTLRACAVILFVVYAVTCARGAWTWAKIRWIRAQDLAQFDVLLRPDWPPYAAEAWIMYRPLKDSAILLGKVEAHTAPLSSMTFLHLSRRARWLHDAEAEKFWAMEGMFRLQYDALRCGSTGAREALTQTINLLRQIAPHGLPGLTPEEQIRIGRKVLAYDVRFPAANDPEDICRILNRAGGEPARNVPKEEWENIRFALRYKSDVDLTRLESRIRHGK
jgi:hypothetical protein